MIELNLVTDVNDNKKGNDNTSTSVIKGRLGIMWAHSGKKWETWLPRMWRSMGYPMMLLAQSSLSHIVQATGSKGRDREDVELPTVGEDSMIL